MRELSSKEISVKTSDGYKLVQVDDILRTMAINQKNYFKLNKENAKDGRNHYFWFEIDYKVGFRNFSYKQHVLNL